MGERISKLIQNDGYALRFRNGRFYALPEDGREIKPKELAELNELLERRRVETYVEKYGTVN